MFTSLETNDTTTNAIDFSLRDSFIDADTVQASFRSESLVGKRERDFLRALRATAAEFDDVLRKLAD